MVGPLNGISDGTAQVRHQRGRLGNRVMINVSLAHMRFLEDQSEQIDQPSSEIERRLAT
jgi:hypothetical protein